MISDVGNIYKQINLTDSYFSIIISINSYMYVGLTRRTFTFNLTFS